MSKSAISPASIKEPLPAKKLMQERASSLDYRVQKTRKILEWAETMGGQGDFRISPVRSSKRTVNRGPESGPDLTPAGFAPLLTSMDAILKSFQVAISELSLSAEERIVNVERLLEQTPIRRLDLVQERLQQRMVTAVLNGTAWLSSAEVGSLGQTGGAPSNPHARAHRLLSEGRVFAIERAGRKEYPRYAFDGLGNPYPALREVLRVFAGWPALRVASWFESASAALDGRRPREVLESDPDAVLRAAQQHMAGPVHG